MTRHRPLPHFIVGMLLGLSLVSLLVYLAPEPRPPANQTTVFSSVPGSHLVPTQASPLPTLSASLLASQTTKFDACYLEGQNADWALIKPHWKYGQMIYVLNWSNPQSIPMLLYVTSSKNTWVKISLNNPYAAVAESLDTGKGQVAVFSLTDGKMVATYPTGFAPSLYEFSPRRLIFTAFDGNETAPRWREVSAVDWSVQFIDSPHQPMIISLEPTANVIGTVHKKVPFCLSWPGYATS